MATPPKTTAGSSPSDATKPAEDKAAASKAASADPQKVDFDLDPDLKKQLDSAGSYKPNEAKTAEYHPPGPHPIGAEGVGGASGGVKMSTDDVKAESTEKPAEKK